MQKLLRRLVRDVSATTAIEYGIIGGLLAVAIVAAFSLVGSSLSTALGDVAGRFG